MAPSKKPGWVDWRTNPGRAVVIQDLRPGGPLYQRDNITAEEIFPWYKQLPAFADVVFDQFQARLKDHRLAASKSTHLAIQEQQYLEHDRRLYPRQSHNERGELVFDMHPAKLLLREDIKRNVHLTTYKTAAQLKASRAEYEPFKDNKFAERIRQEIKLQKYFNYLRLKREAIRNGKKKAVDTNELDDTESV
jgi:hypothetical protein